MNPVNARHAWGGTDASVFAIEGCPAIVFHTEDFKGYDFDYGEIWHTERDLYTKNIPGIPRTYGYGYRYHSPSVANLDNQLSREDLYTEE